MYSIKEKSRIAVEAKNKKMLSKYNWVIAEPYYDIVINNGSTGKSKIFITFRQFKERIEEGKTIKKMIGEGVSKHLLQFFSNFLQGKIKLTKDNFQNRYLEGKELDEISKEFGVQRGDLSYLRQMYNINRKGPTYIKRKKNEVPLTQIQKDLIYGSLMGDAKRQHTKWNSSVGFGHGPKQREYLEWKYFMLKNIATPEGIKKYSQYDKRYDKNYDSHRFYTKANSDVEEILNNFYKEGNKEITTDILANLSDLSLAVWYMDDGSTVFSHKKRLKTGWNITPEIRICTDSFSKKSCENIVKWFKEKWNIDSHLRENRPGQNRIIINTNNAHDFLSLIRPHIIPSMLYKVDYKEYKEKL